MEIEILYDQSISAKSWSARILIPLSMEYYDRTHVDEKTGMTVYDYMSMMIRECKEYVENFKNEKESILFTGNTGCGKDVFEQLHRERTDPQVLFRCLSDSDGYVRYSGGQPV